MPWPPYWLFTDSELISKIELPFLYFNFINIVKSYLLCHNLMYINVKVLTGQIYICRKKIF